MFSNSFKREAEHAADRVAIRNGFRDEIIATKKFILETSYPVLASINVYMHLTWKGKIFFQEKTWDSNKTYMRIPIMQINTWAQ